MNIITHIRNSFSYSFNKGFIFALLDALFRLTALFLWGCFAWLCLSFIWDALFYVKPFTSKIWWLTYSLLSLGTASLLAYVAVVDRAEK